MPGKRSGINLQALPVERESSCSVELTRPIRIQMLAGVVLRGRTNNVEISPPRGKLSRLTEAFNVKVTTPPSVLISPNIFPI